MKTTALLAALAASALALAAPARADTFPLVGAVWSHVEVVPDESQPGYAALVEMTAQFLADGRLVMRTEVGPDEHVATWRYRATGAGSFEAVALEAAGGETGAPILTPASLAIGASADCRFEIVNANAVDIACGRGDAARFDRE